MNFFCIYILQVWELVVNYVTKVSYVRHPINIVSNFGSSGQDRDVTVSDNICRVCRSESTPDRPLYYPCVCTGSIKYIHQEWWVDPHAIRIDIKTIGQNICMYRNDLFSYGVLKHRAE